MNFDALTVAAVRDELRAKVLGGRVQHVHLPDELGLALELYAQGRSHWLYCSAHAQHARAHLVSERPPRTSDAVSPLLLLLRKYVDGARLDAIEQPPLERILRLQFSRRAPSGESWHTELVIEAMGRYSNLILLEQDGSVMDAAKRITAAQSRVRTILPRQRYDPPPAPNKLDPRTLDVAVLAGKIGVSGPATSLRERLVAEVNACSPLLAREVVYRVHGSVDVRVAEADWATLANAFAVMWREAAAGRWGPSTAREGGRLVAYAPYPMESFPDATPVSSISAAIEAWHRGRSATTAAAGADAARKRALGQALEAARDRLRAKCFALGRGLVTAEEVERLRRVGEHLLAFGSEVAPGAGSVVLPDGASAPLDPTKTAVENAQRYFGRYAKAKAAAREVPILIAETELGLRYLDEAVLHLDLASSAPELAALRAEWAELGYVSPAQTKAAKSRPSAAGRGRRLAAGKGGNAGPVGFDRTIVDGFEVLVGRSGRGNDALLSRGARPDDVWLHARGIPGAHVVVRAAGRPVPDGVLRRAASLAAAHSQARTAPSVGVDYTLCKFVDRVKGGPPGLANYRGERTLHVAPEPLPVRST